MTLPPGSQLASYEIVRPLGAGGMGEVYRARDTKLSRDVAIKVLPATLAADVDRLSRFEREARAASALNHPNIVTIYEVGRVDGTSFMAMELIEGKTLRDILGAGPLPLKKLLSVAAQIADGLAKAHDAGIVHRDLKPENVMVTRDGFVKILDFGLAKLVRSGFERSRGVDTPTATRPTEAGTVLGTVGYMSPEQASGEPADFRSDQFSLGTILYEMITARRAFERPTLAQTLTAIIESEPDALATAAPRTPAHLVWIVERCLSKDPQDRYASTTDLARDLAALRDRASGVSISDVEPPSPRRSRLSRGVLAAAAVAVAAAAVMTAVVMARRSVRYQPPTFQQLTFRRGRVLRVRYTPDGASIIYGATWEGAPWEIFTSRLDGTESRPFGVQNADVLAVSSKGELAVLLKKTFAASGTLGVMPLAGGAMRELLENVLAADWSPDGTQLAVAIRENRETRIEYPIGRVLYKTKGRLGYSLRVSGSGKQIAFVESPPSTQALAPDEHDLRIVDATGKVTTLVRARTPRSLSGCLWRRGDREVLFCASSPDPVRGHTSDIDVVDLSGQVRTLYRGTGDFLPQDSSADDRLLVEQSKYSVDLMFGSSTEPSEKSLGWLTSSWLDDISDDGGTILFHDETEVYLRRTDGSPAVRLLPQVRNEKSSLSPDGKWVLSASESEHELRLTPTGPGPAKKISIGELVREDFGFMPDGRAFLFTATGKDGQKRLYIVDETSRPPRAISNTGRPDDWVVSPDGKEIALNDAAGGLSLYPVDGGPSRAVEGLVPGDHLLAWSEDGRFLFVCRDGLPMRVERFELATGRKELWKTLTPPDAAGSYYVGPVLVTRNARFWAYSVNRASLSELWQMSGLGTQ
ncbi:MAG TPA: protein kinase [Thermoanaerobaculia bacterium]|jgi:Tol biopolymer transport system component